MIRLARLLAIASPFALSACSPPPIQIDIQTMADGRMQARLSQDWGFIIPRRKAPCIRAIQLHAIATPLDNPVWQARRMGDDTQCSDLATLIIGTAPPGFAQKPELPTDLRGRYRLTVRGIGYGDTVIDLPPPAPAKPL